MCWQDVGVGELRINVGVMPESGGKGLQDDCLQRRVERFRVTIWIIPPEGLENQSASVCLPVVMLDKGVDGAGVCTGRRWQFVGGRTAGGRQAGSWQSKQRPWCRPTRRRLPGCGLCQFPVLGLSLCTVGHVGPISALPQRYITAPGTGSGACHATRRT